VGGELAAGGRFAGKRAPEISKKFETNLLAALSNS